MICVECLSNVSSACEMKRKCIEADKKLKSLENIELKRRSDEDIIPSPIIFDPSFILNTKLGNDLDGDNESQQTSILLEVLDTENVEEQSIEKDPENDLLKSVKDQNRKSLRLRPKSIVETSVTSSVKKELLESKTPQSKIQKLATNSMETELKEFFCDLCKFSSKRKKNVERHILGVHMKSYKFTCSFNGCEHQYTTNSALKLHSVRDHDESSPFTFYKCEKCDQKFSCESLFKIHQNRLTCRPRNRKLNERKIFEKTLKCSYCDFKTAHKFSLTQHVKLIHLNIRKKVHCIHCQNEYSNRTSLNQHLFNFHNLSHIKCPDCEELFIDENDLKSHKESLKCNARKATDDDFEETSSGVKCNLCNRSYRSKKEWITHYFNHHKFTKVCDICSLQLSTYASLKNHKKTIHEKIKRFSCTECNKAFSAKHTLQFHLNSHSGRKPFSCKFCSFKASDRSSVSKHQKKLHAGMQ
jgi:uncharacterized Zn-finger protein